MRSAARNGVGRIDMVENRFVGNEEPRRVRSSRYDNPL